jgi:hypothetical protein
MTNRVAILLGAAAVVATSAACDEASSPAGPTVVKTGSSIGNSAPTQIQGDRNVAGACSPGRFMESVISCCQDGPRNWATIDGHQAALRIYDTPPCTEADGVGTDCGVGSDPFRPCATGPCGARIEWRVVAEAIQIFQPTSKSGKCGWQVSNVSTCLVGCDWPEGSTRSNPEPYAGQATYSGVTAGCPYRRCLRGGIPAP